MTHADIARRASAEAVRAFDTEGADPIGLGVECESRWRRFAERNEEIVLAPLEQENEWRICWEAAFWTTARDLVAPDRANVRVPMEAP